MSGDGQLALVQSGIFLAYFKLFNWVKDGYLMFKYKAITSNIVLKKTWGTI